MQLFVVLILLLGELFEVEGGGAIGFGEFLTLFIVRMFVFPRSDPGLLLFGGVVVPDSGVVFAILSAVLVVVGGIMFAIAGGGLLLFMCLLSVFDVIEFALVGSLLGVFGDALFDVGVGVLGCLTHLNICLFDFWESTYPWWIFWDWGR